MQRVRIGRRQAPSTTRILAVAAVAVVAACSDQAATGPGSEPALMPLLSAPAPTVFIFGRITDFQGDAVPDPDAVTPPDLSSATITVANGSLTFAVRLATFDPDRTSVTLSLDTDQDPATGHPGIDAGGSDAAIMGTEFIVNLGGAYYAGQAQVMKYVGPPSNLFSTVGTFPVTFDQNGMDVTFPLSAIGNDDGLVNFKVTSQVQITDVGFTGVLDYMPDVGVAAGSTTVLTKESAPVRFHPRTGEVTTTQSVFGNANVGRKFTSVDEACLDFEFSGDVLDPGEEVRITIDGHDAGGFANFGTGAQATRTTCRNKDYQPEEVGLLLDGKAKLQFMTLAGSVTLRSVTLRVTGTPR